MNELNKFLKDIYHFSKSSPELQNSKRRTEKLKGEEIKRDLNSLTTNYLNRFSDILNLDNSKIEEKNKKQESIKAFKRKIFAKNIIKAEEIPENYWKLQKQIIIDRGQGGDLNNGELPKELIKSETERIITEQESSLEYWINYLSDSTATYDIELKYWAFRSILGLQSFNKEKQKFERRSSGTTSEFPEINREALAYVFDFILQKLKKEEIKKPHDGVSDEKFNEILSKSSFAEIYSFAIKEVTKAYGEILENTNGEWIKYNKGSNHIPLVNSLSGKATGWCTAGESTAKTQLELGDFYVYYSEDENGKNTIPRLAIRMEENQIAEIRGIAENQNFDPYISPILEEKIKEFGNEGKKYDKKINDMKYLKEVYKSFKSGEKTIFSKEDLTRFYGTKGQSIEGFGYNKDPRIIEILKGRNRKKDLAFIFDCSEEEISSYTKDLENGKNIVYFDGDLNLSSLKEIPEGFKFPDHIGGNLDLSSLTEFPEGFKFPDHIGGNIDLSSLTEFPEGFKFPDHIGGNLFLGSLTEFPEGFKFPDHILGHLSLGKLSKLPEGFKFPDHIGGNLFLGSLTEFPEGFKFPDHIGGDLFLGFLTKLPEGFKFPDHIGGKLFLGKLSKLPEGFKFSNHIGGYLFLDTLNQEQKKKLRKERPDLKII